MPLLVLALLACSKDLEDTSLTPAETDTDTDSDADSDTDPDTDTDAYTYTFASRFTDGSSVAYDGQSMRMLLINDMIAWLDGVTTRIDSGLYPPAGQIAGELLFYFEFDSASGGAVPHAYTCDPAAEQTVYDDVSSDKDLVGKIAGNDASTMHVDWSTAMVGWDDPAVTSPESLVRLWIDQIDAAAVARANGDIPLGPDGAPLPAVYLTESGQDLSQLLEKFLLGAIAFSQGTDDYLDDDLDGTGILSSNAAPTDGSAYTGLEHAWDEAFGYWGGARDYGAWSDDTVSDVGYADTYDPNGAIDLLSEVCWGASVNAAKRDRDAVVATTLREDVWGAFLDGRAYIASIDGELDAAQQDVLRGYRDTIVRGWEEALAASAVHYVNDTLRDMSAFGTEDYAFADHAKHWSELKGFALSLQFSPHSPLSDADFLRLHDLIGQAPVLETASAADVDAAKADLLEARALLGTAYGFDPANLGDDDGNGGW